MRYDVLLETNLPFPVFKRGKVRDVYDLEKRLLIVSTDRISAFDVVLPNGVPHKGEALNRLSVYWFNQTKNIIPNHILDVVDPRMVLVKKTEPMKIEFVIRGYLYGSAWERYREGKPSCGIKLPPGLREAEKLPEPILTPTTKAEVGHDIEMTKDDVVKKIGRDLAEEIEETCLKIYERASQRAEANGIIVADTKVEFGLYDEELLLIDELFTPDSSRFWPSEKYEVGRDQFSFDKQYVRDYLNSLDWNKQPPAPSLPDHVILETSKKYVEAYERLTGRRF
ncbi:MAG: phosphoribosylaminoimidazolesuccinocarboxamide synthase [Candidatus Bathyarchaeota archaeon]|nr:phosphoribosylaminoimidazolesuccinocarboxamide synthase [Candidatus Bathyarchaeota archaeon]MDH5663410.1 phosphoribosylaminoimidazolesuccinocarboxamide synthase [Candidatus Bathyarchaeota archaeon]